MTAPSVAPEEQARADIYALLAQLFYAPPPPGLLDLVARLGATGAAGTASALEGAWRELARLAGGIDPDAVREEYESLFVGTGRAEVTLYTGAYTLKGALDNPLVAIRGFLATQGLQRKQSVHEPEDHFAALCEVMRHLVMGGDIAVQRKFFDQFIRPATNPLCAAVMAHPRAAFYRAAARFAERFIELEHDAFQMD